MPRFLEREILREIRKSVNAPIEILDVALDPPYTVWQYRFCNNLEPVSLGTITYSPLGWNRGPYQSEMAEAVDRISMRVDDTARFLALTVQTQPIQGARLRLRKVYIGYQDSESQVIPIFDGYAGAPVFDDQTMSFEIRSIADYYETEIPTRTFGPSCSFALGSARCGVDMTVPPNKIRVVAGSGSTQVRLKASALNYPTDHFKSGYVRALNGANIGLIRPVAQSKPGEVTLAVPFPTKMETHSFDVVRGCPHTKIGCNDNFGNLLNYGGFAEVPKTPIIDA